MTTPKPPTPAPPAPPVTPKAPPATPGPTREASPPPAPSSPVTSSTPVSSPSGTEASPSETASTEATATSAATPTTTTTTTTPTTTTTTTEASTTETSPAEPSPDPDRPKDPAEAAWYDAVAAEHAAIYGYGLVSAHVMPEDNELVSESVAQHRDRREAAVALLNQQSLKTPLPAPGYQLPMVVNSGKTAAKLAVRMESDCAVAWRAVLEQTDSEQDREFATKALTQCAVLAARWRKVLGAWPITEAFPGGSE